jgi:hypothetical protein
MGAEHEHRSVGLSGQERATGRPRAIGIDIVCVPPLARWQSRQWQLYEASGAPVMR